MSSERDASSAPLPVMVQGASRGIGAELTAQLLAAGHRVVASCRDPARAPALDTLRERAGSQLDVIRLDVEDEASIATAAEQVRRSHPRLGLLMNVAGVLHGDGHRPERRVEEVEPSWMQRVFAVNAFGPLLVSKHFAPLLRHGRRAVLANLSARVGSIADNRLGGWYAYRGSKAAQNMFTKTLAIELNRRPVGRPVGRTSGQARGAERHEPQVIVVALHPGTVATDLSAPFQRGVPADKLFSVERAARQLLSVVEGLGPESNGGFFAWDGAAIPW